jgi:type II secretory pathway component PulF
MLRTRQVRARLDEVLLRVPVLGKLIGRVLLGRVMRIWAAMLRSHVPLLETIDHSKAAASNAVVLRLVHQVEDAVAAGGRVGRVLASSHLVEPIIASAITTGEENGRLNEAVEFVSDWLDEDNTQLIAGAARLAEPALLTLMGLVVASAALALFVPLFDIAAAGG